MSIFDQLKARQALAEAGIETEAELVQVASVTNEVWMTDDHVVRLGGDESGRLAREAAVAATLPVEVGCPEIVNTGRIGRLTYLVSKRVAGVPLSQVWAHLNARERTRTITSLGERLAVLHGVPTGDLAPLADPPQPLGGADPVAPLLAMIERAGSIEGIDLLLLAETTDRVHALRDCMRTFPTETLVHGDLTFGNILWNDGDVTGILDFEFARGAPLDLDLDIILRMCAYPRLFLDDERADEADPADYAEVRPLLEKSHPAMFAAPRLADRLRLYAIAFTVRELVGFGPIVSVAQQLPAHPQRRLNALIHGTSYLDR